MYVKTPSYIPFLLPRLDWAVSTAEREVFLTFDDGPHPEITPWVLDLLDSFNAKATFFMVGNNVVKNPFLARRVAEQGHAVGNHTFSHLNGWKTKAQVYLDEIDLTDKVMEEAIGFRPRYFRPPYGRLNFFTSKKIREQHRIIMWDVLARDFDLSLTAGQCIENVIKHFAFGSTIVLHDSVKCASRLKIILPEILYLFREQRIKLSPLRI